MRTILLAVAAVSLIALSGSAAALLPPAALGGGVCVGFSLDELAGAAGAALLAPEDAAAILVAALLC